MDATHPPAEPSPSTAPARSAGAATRALRAGRWVFAALVGAVLAATLWARWDQVRDHLRTMEPAAIVTATAAGALAAWATGESWRVLLADLGVPLGRRSAARVFFVGQLAKYLPGGVWTVLAQAAAGRSVGAPAAITAAASLVNLAVVVATGALATTALVVAGAGGWRAALLVAAGGTALLAALHPRILERALSWALARLRRPPLPRRPTGPALLLASALALGSWCLYGVHLWLLTRQATDRAALSMIVLCTGAFAAAWLGGFVVLVAPAGGGAREVALAGMLTTAMPLGAAVAAALLSRLLLSLVDVVFAAAGYRTGRPGRSSPGDPS